MEVIKILSYRLPKLFIIWILFFSCLFITFRVFLSKSFSIVGFIDDLTMLFLVSSVWGLGIYFNRFFGVAIITITSVALILVFLSSSMTFEFFHDYITIDFIEMAILAVDADSSIMTLLSVGKILFFIIIPLILLAINIYLVFNIKNNKNYLYISTLNFTFFLVCFVYVFIQKEDSFIPEQTNPFMHLAYQFIDRLKNNTTTIKNLNPDRIFNIKPLETFYKKEKYPLLRVSNNTKKSTHVQKLNIIIVLMESVRGFELGLTSDNSVITPNLKRMAKEGLFFPKIYFSGTQTARGELATICSVLPNFMGAQVYSQYPELSVYCLPQILKRYGYKTHWFLGYQYHYSNHYGFLSTHGYDYLHGSEQIKNAGYTEKIGWGISDENLFQYGVDVLDKQVEPFFAQFLTISNHHPFNYDYGIDFKHESSFLDESDIYKDYIKGINYTDYTIGKFIKTVRQKPWFDNTVFIFIGDHGINIFPKKSNGSPVTEIEKREMYFRSGLIIWSPKNLPPKTYDIVGSQIDIAPTIMDLLGIHKYLNSFEGISLLTDIPKEDRFAIMLNENAWSFRQGDIYCYALGQSCYSTMYPSCSQGETPKFTGHTCFTSKEDLLSDNIEEIEIHRVNKAIEKSTLHRAKNMVKINNFLLKMNLFSP
ncbi:LTA synthase family protein [Candidatus Venteria ishoeyi]|uniref:Lipoteichoic acid synthase 2 n=1 Tax=Candidatus Venteria ishoeyi TaxID=1899563 RepID=A0A1H6F9A7_9GAMM|nr:LTA synthase family protein [Candidatus Venteria ishoeyi]SEH05565.1 Lipoteichoic acid synthase 2 [Candidatus Venteria ishoeyi]